MRKRKKERKRGSVEILMEMDRQKSGRESGERRERRVTDNDREREIQTDRQTEKE